MVKVRGLRLQFPPAQWKIVALRKDKPTPWQGSARVLLQNYPTSILEVTQPFPKLFAPKPASCCCLLGSRAVGEAALVLTCPHDMLHAGEALVDSRAD